MEWSERHSKQPQANVNIARVTHEIAEAVKGLQARWDELDTKAAFDPNDDETNQTFGKLWNAAFAPEYAPEIQERIYQRLQTSHPDTIETMRKIGYASEWEMEKGFGKNIIEKAKNEGIWFRTRYLEHSTIPPSMDTANRLAKYKKLVDKLAIQEFNPAYKKRVAEMQESYIWVKLNRFEKLIEGFPYPTYEGMSHSESMLMTMLEGLEPNNMFPGTHLIVEAGAIPFTAIYSSISRLDGEVIITNSDEEAHKTATKLISELERLKVLEPGCVKSIHIDPLSPEFAKLDFQSISDTGQKPYAATITQRVAGAEKIQQIMQTLNETHQIDPIVTRDAHGLVKLLYEPIDPEKMKGIAPQKLMTIPTHSDPEAPDNGHKAFFPRLMCYNTSRIFSNEKEVRKEVLDGTDPYAHMFCTKQSPRVRD